MRKVLLFVLVTLATVLPGAAEEAAPGGVIVSEQQGLYRVVARFVVPASPDDVLQVLTDYESIPRFMPDVKRSTVRLRETGRTVVEQEAEARVMMFSKKLHLLLEVREQAGALIFVDTSGRSFTSYEGVWRMAPADGQTTVTYELHARPGFDVPRFVLVRALRNDSTRMIERLREEIAARHAHVAD